MSLKRAIEDYIAEEIYDIAGFGSPSLDPDLPTNSQLQTSLGGVYPFDQELRFGPLARVMIEKQAQINEEFGSPQATVSALAYTVGVVGITAPFFTGTDAADSSADLEEIIRLHLQDMRFTIETSLQGGRLAYAAILTYEGTTFDQINLSSNITAPRLSAPVASGGNSGNILLSLGPNGFMGLQNITYTVEVTASNLTASSISGLAYRYKEDANPWVGPFAAGSNNPLSNDVHVLFSPLGIAQIGDAWTFQGTVNRSEFIGFWQQAWTMVAEATAVS